MIEEEIEEIMDEDERSYTGTILPYTQLEEALLNFFRDASIFRSVNESVCYFFDVQCEVHPASAVCVITRIGLFAEGYGSYSSEDGDLPAFERTHFRNDRGVTFDNIPFRYDAGVLMSYQSYDDASYSHCVANYIYDEILFKTDLLGRDGLFRCVPGHNRYVQRKRVIDVPSKILDML